VQSKSEKVHLNFEKLTEANISTEIISCQTSNIQFSKSKISKMKIQIQAFELQISFCVGHLRLQQLLREDVRDLTQIHQLNQLELLVNLLMTRSGHQLIYSNLATDIQVSVDTVRRWIATLCNLHLGFLVRPWFKNVSRSLRKEPKWFLRDWSSIEDPGEKAETFVACHLLKAVEGWNDMGLGNFQLNYLRDRNQREVDFVVIKDTKPWFLVEVKNSDKTISPSLSFFQDQIKAPFAFQVVLEADYVDADCFSPMNRLILVPAKTFLSQLL
jgi:predicted AAA+ superfamily ATPase